MIRREHRVALWIVVLAVAGCGGDRHRPASAGAPSSQAQPAVSTPPDATPPNRVLDPTRWSDPRVKAAYAAAQSHAAVLERLYCYCHCHEHLGHRALVECYETDHASGCDICINEAMIAGRMTDEGRSPQEIQKAIDVYYSNS